MLRMWPRALNLRIVELHLAFSKGTKCGSAGLDSSVFANIWEYEYCLYINGSPCSEIAERVEEEDSQRIHSLPSVSFVKGLGKV